MQKFALLFLARVSATCACHVHASHRNSDSQIVQEPFNQNNKIKALHRLILYVSSSIFRFFFCNLFQFNLAFSILSHLSFYWSVFISLLLFYLDFFTYIFYIYYYFYMRDIANSTFIRFIQIYSFNNTSDTTRDSQNNRYYRQEEERDIAWPISRVSVKCKSFKSALNNSHYKCMSA